MSVKIPTYDRRLGTEGPGKLQKKNILWELLALLCQKASAKQKNLESELICMYLGQV